MATLEFDRKAPCGCSWKRYHNDDPAFDGYESDREEETRTYCYAHRARLVTLDREREAAYQRLSQTELARKRLLRAIEQSMQ